MTVEELATRLNAEAEDRGISTEQLVDELLARVAPHGRRLGFVGLGASTTGRHADEADAMLSEGFGRD